MAARGIVKKIATKRMEILYDLAKETYKTDPALSIQYVKLIRQISRHYKIPLDRDFKKNVCKKCNSVLLPGKSSQVRIVSSKKYVLIRCLNCGTEMHVHY
jgi:ribonuclease P protein subunit RPR2